MILQVDLVSAERRIHSGTAAMVFAPAAEGEVGILPNHAPMLTLMRPGDVRIRLPDGSMISFFVSGGILEVRGAGVTILSDTVLRADEIDEKEADEARRQAEQALKGERGPLDYAQAHAQLTEALAKLRIVKLAHTRRGEE